jgi:hypothetical protein
MSQLTATYDLNNNTWAVALEQEVAPDHGLSINFVSNSIPMSVSDLKFGYRVSKDSTILQTNDYPALGIKYQSIDDKPIINTRLYLPAGADLEFYIWAENSGIRGDYTLTVNFLVPPSPHPSWIWDGDKWDAPVPRPADDNSYIWSDSTNNWEIFDTSLVDWKTAPPK